jgi:hypothetical protein
MNELGSARFNMKDVVQKPCINVCIWRPASEVRRKVLKH